MVEGSVYKQYALSKTEIGLVLLIPPGLFLLTALFFYHVFIAVEDDTSLQALRNSWSLTAGHRLRLFALRLLVTVLIAVVSGLFCRVE